MCFCLLLSLIQQRDFEICVRSYVNGVRYSVSIDKKIYDTMTGWDDSDENPPLSPRKAIRAASSLMEKIGVMSDDKKWTLRSVVLEKVYDKWFWSVHFQPDPKVREQQEITTSFCVFVLMDGKAIEPVIDTVKKR